MGPSERIRADIPWMEPIDAYACLRDQGALLLDGMGAHPEARYAYVATGFDFEARLNGRQLTITRGGETTRQEGDPRWLIQSLADGIRRDVDEPEMFTGGLVGYFGYEFVSAIEPTLPRHDADTPDALLWLARDAIVFDRREQRAWVWCNGDDAEARCAAILECVAATPPIAWPSALEPNWQTSMDEATFSAAVQTMRRRIEEGDLYQANIATRFSMEASADAVALYRALSRDNPSPFMALIEADDHAIVSCSPEQLLAVSNGRIRTRPIAGTRPRSADAPTDQAFEDDLVSDAKERAEHTMLVDLLRNDIAKVSRPGTVVVDEMMSVERYRHVMHLVSSIHGDVAAGTDFVDWLAALFPGGTITGAPKHRACMRIHEAEPVPRGPYTGSAGFLSWSHNTHWNIMIRTMVLKDGEIRVHAGSGIVADSEPAKEWREAGTKAASLLAAATGRSDAGGDRLGDVTARGDWNPPTAEPVPGRRVFIVDNYDSFTHNLADYAAALDAEVLVVRNDVDVMAALTAFAPTHVILGPGPGRPEDSAGTLEVLRAHDGPILGVCLGHQAMAFVDDIPVVQTGPVHGKTASVSHDGGGVLAQAHNPLLVARYHSLGVRADDVSDGWHVDAHLDDGTVMAMHHVSRPWSGVQFHPESVCTHDGMVIMRQFLLHS